MRRPRMINGHKVICGPVSHYYEIWLAFEKYAQKQEKLQGWRPPIGDPIRHSNGLWYMVEKNYLH